MRTWLIHSLFSVFFLSRILTVLYPILFNQVYTCFNRCSMHLWYFKHGEIKTKSRIKIVNFYCVQTFMNMYKQNYKYLFLIVRTKYPSCKNGEQNRIGIYSTTVVYPHSGSICNGTLKQWLYICALQLMSIGISF
jgi:hypothetical protein